MVVFLGFFSVPFVYTHSIFAFNPIYRICLSSYILLQIFQTILYTFKKSCLFFKKKLNLWILNILKCVLLMVCIAVCRSVTCYYYDCFVMIYLIVILYFIHLVLYHSVILYWRMYVLYIGLIMCLRNFITLFIFVNKVFTFISWK